MSLVLIISHIRFDACFSLLFIPFTSSILSITVIITVSSSSGVFNVSNSQPKILLSPISLSESHLIEECLIGIALNEYLAITRRVCLHVSHERISSVIRKIAMCFDIFKMIWLDELPDSFMFKNNGV